MAAFATRFFCEEKENAEIINDAVLKRNTLVEERLGVKINVEIKAGGGSGDDTYMNTVVHNSILSGDRTYDIVSSATYIATKYVMQGII